MRITILNPKSEYIFTLKFVKEVRLMLLGIDKLPRVAMIFLTPFMKMKYKS